MKSLIGTVLPRLDAASPEPVISAGVPVVIDVVPPTMLEAGEELVGVAASSLPVVVKEVTDLDVDPCVRVVTDCRVVALVEPMALTKPVSVEAAEMRESKTVSAITVSTASPPIPVYGEDPSVGVVEMDLNWYI